MAYYKLLRSSSFCFLVYGYFMDLFIFEGGIMRETGKNGFQSRLIKDISERFPGVIIMKNDPNYLQGIPDLIILYNDKWATLEVKKDILAKHQPNQDYYVEKMNSMSYSTFVYPENEEEVLNDLEKVFQS